MRKLVAILTVAILLVVICGYVLWAQPAARERELFVPIAASGLPQGVVLESALPQGIEIRVQGPAKVLEKMALDTPLIYPLDLSRLTPGVHTIELDGRQLAMPLRVQLISIHPGTIELRAAQESRKQVPIQLVHTGTPGPGFYVSGSEIVPATVEIRGSTRRLAEVSRVLTLPVNIDAATGTATRKIPLDLPPEVTCPDAPELVAATLRIQRQIVVRQFTEIPVVGKSAQHPFTIHPAHIALEVKGPSNIIEKGHAAQGIEAFVDLKGLAPGVYVRRASIRLPLEAELVGEVEPELFTVQIEGESEESL